MGLVVSGDGAVLAISVTICVPVPTGSQYWLIAKNSAGDFYPKGALAAGPGTVPFPSITLGSGVEHGSRRTFFVASVPAGALSWMNEALAHDSDGVFDGKRGALPNGVVAASTEVASTYT